LVCFQLLMFLVAIYVSRRDRALAPRLTVMVLIGLLVRTSEYTNAWAAAHWRSFATQNYFDERGIFAATMVCGPLLLDTMWMLVCFLREGAALLVQVKTIKMGKKKRKTEQQPPSTTTTKTAAAAQRPKKAKAKKEQ
jgi:transmembrane protein 18